MKKGVDSTQVRWWIFKRAVGDL